MENEVKIIFKGDSNQLSNAIKQLDNATKKLLNTQAKINDFNKKQEKIDNSRVSTFRRLNTQLKLKGSSLKAVGLSTSMYKKALQGNAYALDLVRNATKKHIAELGKQRKELRRTKTEQISYNNETKKATKNLFSLGHSARNGTDKLGGMGGAFSVLRSKLLLFNFAMGLGIRQVGKLVAEASRVDAMRTAFATLSEESDGLTVSLKKITEATNGTMSEFDLFQQANNAMILGVTKNSDEMAEMFDIAQRLGRALGKDTAQSVESLVTGIGRQSRLMLDNIGIIVKSEEAYEAYAKKLGKATKDLTDAEKKQAFLEATMESARKKVADLGDEVLTTRDDINSFTASSQNLSVAIGEVLSPAFGKLSKESATVLNNLRELIEVTTKTKSVNLDYYDTLTEGEEFVKEYAERFDIVIDPTKTLMGQVIQLTDSLKILKSDASIFSLEVFHDALNNSNEMLERLQSTRDKFFKSALPEGERPQIDFKFNVSDDIDDVANEVIDEFNKKTLGLTIDKDLFGEDFFKDGFFPDLDEFIKEEKEKFELRKIVFKDTKEFRLQQIDELAKRLQKAGLTELAYTTYIENEKLKIEEEFAQKKKEKEEERLKSSQDAIKEIAEANKTLYANNIEFQMLQIDLQAEKFREMKLNEQAITEFTEEAKREAVLKNLEEQSILYNSFVAGYDTFINSLTDLDMSFEDKKKAILESTAKAFVSFLANMAKEQLKQAIANEVVAKTSQATAIASSKVTGSLIAQSYAVPASLVSTATFGASAGAGQSALTASITATKSLATFEDGGLIGGRRHSQGGTIIEAERGEFVMSRNAVQSIGVETLNQMNQGNATGITINVSAPLVDETILDTIIPAIEEAQKNNLA
jgi:hypothetical protein